MKIVLEGMDASGKSTLSEFLSVNLNLPIIHPGGPPSDDHDALMGCIKQALQNDCIYDRVTCISRQAYQLDRSQHHYEVLNIYLKEMVSNDAVFIFCVGKGPHEVKDRDSEELMNHISENYDTIVSRYEDIFKRVPHFRFDFNVNSNEEVLRWIKSKF